MTRQIPGGRSTRRWGAHRGSGEDPFRPGYLPDEDRTSGELLMSPAARRGVRPGTVVALVLLAFLGGGVLGWTLKPPPTLSPSRPPAQPGSTAPVASASTPGNGRTPDSRMSAGPSAAGRLRGIVPTGVRASCVASPAPDSTGRPVSYQPQNVLDRDPDTAWRCDGDSRGERLVFGFDPGTVLVGVGMVNGYDRTDPLTHESLYQQYRRVLQVRWTLPNAASAQAGFSQQLTDNHPLRQEATFQPVILTGEVTLTITGTSAPGLAADPARDAVLISEVSFWTRD